MSEKKEVNAQPHRTTIVCGWCRQVMAVGCRVEDPCSRCEMTDEASPTDFVFATCEGCQEARPWHLMQTKPKSKIRLGQQWQAVDSSFIKAVRYDGAKQKLYVMMTNGNRYAFKGVPSHVYATLLRARSKGKMFNEKIVNKYDMVVVKRVQ